MDKMFCNQCEQSARRPSESRALTGCTMAGVCGKSPVVAGAQDELTCEMIALATAARASGAVDLEAVDLCVDGLFTTLTNVNFDDDNIAALTARVRARREALGGAPVISPAELFAGEEVDLVSLRSTLLFGMRGLAAYAHHARLLGARDGEVDAWVLKGLAAFAESRPVDAWVSLVMEFGQVNLACMALLDRAHNERFGAPVPTEVPLCIEPGPFIVISGHDLLDMEMLLQQTEGKNINVYTHGEMLPGHGYPELKKYAHLKGNFGTAWQNQQREFDGIPAPVLFTTNCLMAPRPSYQDRVYTTSVVAFPALRHIAGDKDGHKDFSPIIEQALALGGYSERQERTGINGGKAVTTGFGRQTVLDAAPAIIDAVKQGAIRHFFLVGGCDGAAPGRNYYTDFVKQTPPDTVVLTLACGKYRFNDIDAGHIGPFPRILDMGQCNDAYGAIQVAVALAGAFECGVNDLPLTLVLSWYEQKAVCILLTLLSLGIQNIYIGPRSPAFFSENVLNLIVEKFNLHLISTPEADLGAILGA